MHQFKGSSSRYVPNFWKLEIKEEPCFISYFTCICSIGAKKVKKECTQFQEYCEVENFEGYLSFPLFHVHIPFFFWRETHTKFKCMCNGIKRFWQFFFYLFKHLVQNYVTIFGFYYRCMREFQEVKQEHAALKRKLENYFQVFLVVLYTYNIHTYI